MNISNSFCRKKLIFLILITLSCILHAQPKDCTEIQAKNGIYVVAHRGAHNGIPENSIAAYQKAIELGCDFVEIDVRTTSDGKFVSIHNPKIDEYVTGQKGKVSDLTLEQLRSLDIGAPKGARWKGTRIPTFEEILDLCQGKIGIYLDLKAAHPSGLVEIIKKHSMEKEIIWYISASDAVDTDELKASCPECILMPDPGSASHIKTISDKLDVCIMATDMEKLTPDFVKIAHKSNIKVFTDEKDGTVAEWQKIIKWKIDGIQTDKPEELISFLKSHKNQ